MKQRILIAEDEPNIVISLEFLLVRAGYEVTAVHDGTEALDAIIRLRPELVVLDVMLPGVNGFEVCRQVRAASEMRNTRILMLTARGRETEMERGMMAGADAYMTKPFATRELLAKVAELLG